MNLKEFGLKLKQWRNGAGQPIDLVAEHLEILPSRLVSYETGRAWIPADEYYKLVKLYDVSEERAQEVLIEIAKCKTPIGRAE